MRTFTGHRARNANGDMFFYSDIFMVADYHHAESRVKDLIGRFVGKRGKEFYQLHYTELRDSQVHMRKVYRRG